MEHAADRFEEIAKGVFQLWRFFNQTRSGLVPNLHGTIQPDTVGVVLMLDEWMELGELFRDHVISSATAMADASPDNITARDRRKILFVSIHDLEEVLSHSTSQSFLHLLRLAQTEKYDGWALRGIQQDSVVGPSPSNKYPFIENLREVMPWIEDVRATIS